MLVLTQSEELLFVRHVHLISERIKSDKPLTEDLLLFIKKLYPELFSILTRIQPEEAFIIFEKYKGHPFYRADMEIVLSPKGKEIVIRELEIIRAHSAAEK